MKCETCGLDMELWQSSASELGLIKRYRCVCGFEKAEIVSVKPPVEDKPKQRYDKADKLD